MLLCDWSSDVYSSELQSVHPGEVSELCEGPVSKNLQPAAFETPFRQAQWLLRTNGGWKSRPPNEHRPRRIPRAERADQPGIARDHILMVQMKGDDRPRARRIAIGVEPRRALVLPRLMAQHALREIAHSSRRERVVQYV